MSRTPEDRILDDEEEEEKEATEAPLTMAASLILTALPKDASRALDSAGPKVPEKVTIRLHAIGSAPPLRQTVFKVKTEQSFATIVRFLRKKLGVQAHESVFCYIGNVFSPGLDEGVGNLWTCFKTGEELAVGYAITPAFG